MNHLLHFMLNESSVAFYVKLKQVLHFGFVIKEMVKRITLSKLKLNHV